MRSKTIAKTTGIRNIQKPPLARVREYAGRIYIAVGSNHHDSINMSRKEAKQLASAILELTRKEK